MRNIAETLYKFFLTLFYITTYRYIYKLQSHRRKINVLLIIWYKCIDTQIRQKIVVCYLTFNCWHLRLKKLTRLVTVNYQKGRRQNYSEKIDRKNLIYFLKKF